jgi:serine protease Do
VSSSLPPGDPYGDYVDLTDDTGRITVTVPAAWSDTLGSAWERDGEEIGVALSASPDRDAFYDTWGMPGLFLGSSDRVGSITGYLDATDFGGSCAYEGRFDYEDPLYAGQFDRWVDCGPEGSVFEMLAVLPLEVYERDGPDVEGLDLIVVEIIMVTEADREAAERIYDTFVVQ